MGRYANAWTLAKASGRILRADKELLLLPVLSFAASLLTLVLIAGAAWTNGLLPSFTDAAGHTKPLAIVLGAALYLGLAFVNVFFAAALIAGANERLNGRDPTLGSALAAATRRLPRLLAWSVVTATVSVILQALRERGGLGGRIAAIFGGIAWNLATYFVLPVLMFETTPMTKSIGRSTGLLRKTWGETILGNIAPGLVFGLAMIPLALLMGLGILVVKTHLAAGVALLAAAVLGMILVSLLQTTFNGIYRAALYNFATTSQVPPGFEATQMQAAFRSRGT